MFIGKLSKLFLGLVVTAGLVMGGAVTANAAGPETKGNAAELPTLQSQPTPEQMQEGFLELLNSPLPRATEVVGNEKRSTFTLEGLDFTIVEPLVEEGVMQPFLGGGWGKNGIYVDFNKFDQDAIISGSAWILGAAICAIPAVGTVACISVSGILAAATLYLSYNGPCPGNKVLRVYTVPGNHCV